MHPGRGVDWQQPVGAALTPAWPPLHEPASLRFHVFICHAGEQKRGFVDFLRQSFETQFPLLHVFLDQHPVHSGGEEQWLPLRNLALQGAAVVIVVLSREFILSRDPMEALRSLLLDRDHPGPRASTLLPVFYDITAAEVAALLAKGQQAPPGMDRERWLADLRRLLQLNGVPHAQDCEATGPSLVWQVVGRTAELLADMHQLPVSKTEELPDVRVGLERATRLVVDRLSSKRQRACMVLLHGMGGIGKTTLAKAVFNELQSQDPTALCHFLRLDPEGMEEGVVRKQQELLRGLCCAAAAGFTTAAEGREVLGRTLQGRRVLVVVDNVWDDALEQMLPGSIMGVLGKGSKVLVTSRMSGAAARLAGQQCVREVAVELLSGRDSWELLCRHAGYSSSAAADNAALIQSLVARCGGLPMALEVIGKRLSRVSDPQAFLLRPEEAVAFAYKSVRAGRLEKHRTLFEELQLSWDALGAGEKEALLDVALILEGQPWELVGAVLKEGVLERLRKLAFVSRGEGHAAGQLQPRAVNGKVKVNSKVKVKVHPVILDFCKMAAWGCEDQRLELDVEDTGTDPIWDELATLEDAQGLKLRGHELDAEACNALSALQELRVLLLEGGISPALRPVVLSGLSNLRYLHLQGPPAAGSLTGAPSHSLRLQEMGRLAVLVLERLHRLERLESLQGCPALHTVSIAGCSQVERLQLGGLPALEGLQIEDCEALTQLDLRGCSRLRTLPEGVGQLGSLQALHLEGCSSLAQLPEGLGQLSGLQTLDLKGCSGLRELPESLGELSALQDLHLGGCSGLTQLPGSVVQLRALQTLDLKGCSGLTALPEGLAHLPLLQTLDYDGCTGILAQLLEPLAGPPRGLPEVAASAPSPIGAVQLSVKAILNGREHLPTVPSHVHAWLRVENVEGERRRLLHEEVVLLECRPGRRHPQRLKYSVHCSRPCAGVLSNPSTRWKLARNASDNLLVTAVLGAALASPVQSPSSRPSKRGRATGCAEPRGQAPRFNRSHHQAAPLVDPGPSSSTTPRLRH